VAEIVLLHSALGLRPGVAAAADRLREAGHIVHTPDLFPGDAPLETYRPAADRLSAVGIPVLAERARAAVDQLPGTLVYAGFSIGASLAAHLAARRPGARAAILLHGAFDPVSLGLTRWPSSVPMQIHFSVRDRYRDNEAIGRLSNLVRSSGAECSVFDYPGAAHLFADPSLPSAYNPESAELMWTRVLDLLARIDTGVPQRSPSPPDRPPSPAGGRSSTQRTHE
jgi:dienelactone hydrolase